MLRTLNTWRNRFSRAMRIIRTGQVEEKQFAFMWFDPSTRNNIQWHLVDYESYAKEGYSQNALANIAIKYKTDSFALVSLRAYKGTYDNPKPLPENSPLQMLLSRPNPYQSQFQFMQLADTYFNIDGNCFIYKKPAKGGSTVPEALYTLRPDRVFIKPIETKGRGDVLYLYVPNGRQFPNGIPIERQDMMHIKTPNPLDPLEGLGYGLPPLMPIAKMIDQDNMQTEFLYNVFKHQGIMPGGYLEVPFEMEEDDMAKLRREFEDAYGGHDKWGRPMIVDGGSVYKPGNFTLDQLDVSALDKRISKRSMAVNGVPAMLIGLDDDGNTFNNVEEADKSFWQRTMKAELKIFGDEFAYGLRTESGEFVQWDTSDVPAFQEDLLEASQIYMNLVQYGVPPNVAAQRVNLGIDVIEGGDIPYMIGTLVPIQRILEPPEPAPTPFSGDRQTPDENIDENTDNSDDSVDDDTEDAAFDTGLEVKSSRWTFDQKAEIWKAVDDIAEDNEDEFGKAAVSAFTDDRQKVSEIIDRNTKAVISWADVRRNIDLYLTTSGAENWRRTFQPVIIELSRQQTDYWSRRAPDVFPPSTFNLRNVTAEAWFNRYLLSFSTEVNDTTRNDIHRIIQDGLEFGLSNDEMAKRLLTLFDQYSYGNTDAATWEFLQDRMPVWRREMIARTESHGASSYGNHALYQQAGVKRKEWLATADTRTRDSHLVAWNRYSEGGNPGPITLDQYFMVGGAQMLHPGDRNAPPSEFIQCRCSELPFLE